MKIKTSKLTGAALDWAVANCKRAYEPSIETDVDGTKRIGYGGMFPEWSTDWAYGGPIIESERININPDPDAPEWYAYYDNQGKWWSGSMPLIAAMRCFVAYQIGDEIDIPEELT